MRRPRPQRARDRLVPVYDGPILKASPKVIESAVAALRNAEDAADRKAAAVQRQMNLLACIYGRHVQVDTLADIGTWKMLQLAQDRQSGAWRRGRPGMLPSRQNICHPLMAEVVVAPDVAEALIVRDGTDLSAV